MSNHEPGNIPEANIDAMKDTSDPGAIERIRKILDHPNYRQADEDVDFLNEDGTRGVRLEIDYQKAEHILQKAGICHSIVVFGSARILSNEKAQQKLKNAEETLKNDPDNAELQHQLSIAISALRNSKYYEEARSFGRLVGNSGAGPQDCRLTLFTGGGPGLMEAANRGAFDVGAKSVGLNISLPFPQFPNSYITPDLCFRFHYFAMRKLHFVKRARALVAFPGGYGTLDELFGLLTLIQTQKIEPVPVILVGREYWENVINFDYLIEGGYIAAADRDLVKITDTGIDAWNLILQWYEDKGKPLINNAH